MIMTKSTNPAITESEKTLMNTFTKTAIFDLNGLNPRLTAGSLRLEIPALISKGPMFTAEFIDNLTKAGMTMNEIETEMDNFHLAIEKKLFVKVLADRLTE